jgi:NitT/TauT family transport system substrate-binding protein
VAGGITGANLFNAVARGLDIRIIADKGTNYPGKSYYNLVVRKDLAGEIKDYKDLKGRKIGLFSVGTLNEYTVEQALAKGGLTVNDVTLVPLGPPDMNVALANKSIDVGMQIEPLITQAEQTGIAVPWKETTDFLPGGQIAVVLAGPKFAENKAVAERFMVAYLQGLRDYNDAFRKGKDTEAIIDILAKYSEVKEKAVWRSVRVTGLNPNGAVSKESLIDQYNWYRKKGTVLSDVAVDKVIDMSLVDFAVKHLGEYK